MRRAQAGNCLGVELADTGLADAEHLADFLEVHLLLVVQGP